MAQPLAAGRDYATPVSYTHLDVYKRQHQGYGFPIGGVVATQTPDGVISPGGVGYDINCGVRLLGTRLSREEIAPYLDELATQLQRNCPHGVGRGGEFKLNNKEMAEVVRQGARWALKRGYATEMDLELSLIHI